MRTLFTISLIALIISGVNAQNLILNPGFETATVGIPSGQPIPSYPTELNHWTATATDGEFILEPTLAYAGNGFLSVLQNSGAYNGAPWLGGGGGGYDQAGQVFPVQPSTGYDLLFWYRAGDGSRYGYGAGDMVVHVESIAPAMATLTSIVAPTTLTWQLYTKTFVTGPNDTQAIVLFACMGSGDVDTWIDDVEIYPSLAIGVADHQKLQVKTYPNPVSENLYVSGLNSDDLDYQVLSMLGSVVSAGALTSSAVNVSHLPDGMYLLRVTDGTSTAINKFQIKR